MSTPSTLLLCAGAASSLAAVWTLAGFSESSAPRFTPRVLAAAGIGLAAQLLVFVRASGDVRRELSLAMLFGLASVAALVVGAAKIEGALLEKDGMRVVRRSAGIVTGTVFGMAAIGTAALDLSGSSLAHARAGWALMFGLLLGTCVVFAQRGRYLGVGALVLGARTIVLGLIGAALLFGARLTAAATSLRPTPAATSASAVAVVAPTASAPLPTAPSAAAGESAAPTPSSAPSASVAAAPSAVPSASAAPSAALAGKPGELQIESVVTRGLLEADVRGGVARRLDRLQACTADPKNNQSGALTLKVGIDAAGSVTYTRPTGGDLVGTPLATCLLPVFYKMGFAAPASNSASFEITLRAPPQ